MKAKGCRNRRIFDIIQIQQQISHYNHIIQAKPKINLHCQSPVAASRLRGKFYNQVERSRLLENYKLVRRLTQIKNSKGLLHEDNYRQRLAKNNYSLQSDYKLMENEKERLKHNIILLDKLKTVKPQVGTYHQWNEHYEQFQNNQKKLSKLNPQLMGLEDLFYNTYAGMTSKHNRSRKKLVSQHCEHNKHNTTLHNKITRKYEGDHNRTIPEKFISQISDDQNKLVESGDNPEYRSQYSQNMITKSNTLNCDETTKHRYKRRHRKRKHKKTFIQTQQAEKQSTMKMAVQSQGHSIRANNIYQMCDKQT